MVSSKKIWGVYTTLDETKLDNLSEFEIWKKIAFLTKEINCMLNYGKKPGNKDINIKALITEQFNLEYLIYYTKKFGVEFDEVPSYGKHIEKSESFNNWYKYWINKFNENINLKSLKNNLIDLTPILLNDEMKDSKELQKVYK